MSGFLLKTTRPYTKTSEDFQGHSEQFSVLSPILGVRLQINFSRGCLSSHGRSKEGTTGSLLKVELNAHSTATQREEELVAMIEIIFEMLG